MRLTYIKNGWLMTVKELFRSRIVLILLFAIPTLFYTITVLTTTNNPVFFKLAVVSETLLIVVKQRGEGLIFMGLTSVGLLASFLALNLIQKNTQPNRRLVICGYRSSELAFSKLLVLLCVIVVVGGYVAVALPLFFKPRHLMALVFRLYTDRLRLWLLWPSGRCCFSS